MYIREDLDEVLARNQAFFAQKQPGSALCMVRDVSKLHSGRTKPLNAWNMDTQLHEFLDSVCDNNLAYFERRASLRDDLLPAISPRFGIAELTAYCGGAVVFEATTSFHQQTIPSLDEIPDGLFPETSVWHERVLGGMAYMKERLQGRLFVKMRGGACPIDILNALRGNDLFYDFYDDPDALCGLMDRAADALARFMRLQYDAADHVGGGVISGFETWMPGNWFGHLSEDASVMCSAEIYREFARPYTEKALSGFDGAFMHTHSMGVHAIPDIAAIEKIRLLEISSDPNTPRAIEVAESLEQALADKILVLAVTPQEILEHLPFLKRRPTVLWLDTDTLDEAEDVLALVRRELPIRL